MLKFDSFDSVPFEVARGDRMQVIQVGSRFAVAGTAYGFLHASNGDRATFNSRRTAQRRMATLRDIRAAGW